MGTTISESARIGSGSTGAASGIRLRRVVQPVFNDNACGKHRLMVIPRLSYNFLDPLRKRMPLPFLYALPVARRSWTGTRRRTWSVSPSRSGCRRATTAAAPGTSVFERPASEHGGKASWFPSHPLSPTSRRDDGRCGHAFARKCSPKNARRFHQPGPFTRWCRRRKSHRAKDSRQDSHGTRYC